MYEDDLYCCGFENIAGVDEVGRGSLAGPIVAAAVILKRDRLFITKLNDSKKLSANIRAKLYLEIIHKCQSWSIASLSSKIIDKISLSKANILVMKKAVLALKIKPDIVITDAFGFNTGKTGIDVFPIIKGDEKSASIAAASIIAKVFRDRIMAKYSEIYPEYGFAVNKGYGTRKHQAMLQKYGPSKIHRISFKGVIL